jgi:xylulokinase
MAVKRMLMRSRVPGDQVAAIGITGQWSGTVPVDKAGNALGNAVIWYDSRGSRYVARMMRGLVNVGGYAVDKLARWLQVVGAPPGNAGTEPIGHILYLQAERPGLYQSTFKFLEPIDFVGLRMTGCIAASFDSIVLHWLTDNRDIRNVHYDAGLVKLSGIDAEKLPELRPADAVLGTLLPEVASEWGLRSDVKVIMGSPDTHSAAVGSGAVRDYECHFYVGTSSWMAYHYPVKRTDFILNQGAFPSAIPGRYIVMNSQQSAGACLQYLRDQVLFPDDALAVGSKPENAYELMNQLVEQTPAGSGKLIFTPWLYGERMPIDDRYVRGGFFNQSLQTTRADMVRAVYEGIAYSARWVLSQVEPFIKRRAEAINVVGGGAKADIWCQILADVLERPMRQMKDPIHANVRGAALLASAALGYVGYEDIPGLVPVAKTFVPNPVNAKIYDELFAEFKEIYKNNKGAYRRLNS